MNKRTVGAGAAITIAVALAATGIPASQASEGGATRATEKPDESPIVASAREHLGTHPSAVGFGKHQKTTVRNTIVDPDGDSHVRFDRSYNGLEVVGGDFVVHQDASGDYESMSGQQVPGIRLSTEPGITASRAANVATEQVMFSPETSTPKLVVDATGAEPALAWRVQVEGVGKQGQPAGEHVYVDADTGTVLRQVPTVLNEKGTGNSLYLGEVHIETTKEDGGYSMVDPKRGNGETLDAKNKDDGTGVIFTDADNVWGDGTNEDRATAAVDAHFGVASTWDYFEKVHGRDGIGDDGKGARSYVHVGDNWFNASWSESCFCMSYGDGDGQTAGPLVELDITGHEMSHGVTSRTADLEYIGESGGLNEATSDIFGTMVEFHTANAEDPADYVIGEEIFLDPDPENNFIRRMDEPTADGRSYDCYESGIGDADVHYSSGLANHFFYLLSEGSGKKDINGTPHESLTCDGSEVEGIGNEKAAAIWYKALTAYMTSTTDYAGAREATLSAAEDLYGADSPEYGAVDRTWAAVSVTASS